MILASRKLRPVVGLQFFAILMVGVLVWPPPQDALAVDVTFRARVDWNGNTADNNGVQLRVTTRNAVGGAPLETRVMTFQRLVEGVGFYQISFTPNRQARVWDVTLVNIRQHRWAPTSMMLRDSNEILVGIVSDLDASFICIDQ